MKQKLKRLLSSVLASATVFSSLAGTLPRAGAISGGDTVTLIYENDKQTYLREQKNGSWVSLPIHEGYALENGEKLQVYCMDHGKHGIHEIAPSTNKHTYILDSGSGYTQNPKAVGVIMRGSGRLSLQSFLNQFTDVPRDLTEDEYRYATQTAMWAALGQLSVSGTAFTSGNAVQVSSSYGTQGERVMAATRALLNYAKNIDHNYYVGMYLRHGPDHSKNGVIDWSPTSGTELNAENKETHDGEEYYTQEIKVASASFCQNNALNVSLSDALPGTMLQIVKDGDHASAASPSGASVTVKPIAQTTDANANGSEYYAIVKIWVPKEEAEKNTDYAFSVQISATVESFEIFVGRASGYENSTEYQKYLISGPQWTTADSFLPIKWGNVDVPDVPDDPGDPGDPGDPDEPEEPGELILKKIDADTGETLTDCTIEVEHIESGFKTTATTLGDGLATIELPADKKGGWKATEIAAPPGYEKDPDPVQTFSWDGKATPIALTFKNHRKPSILFVKRDALTGETLPGAIIEVSRNDQKIGDYETQEDGTFTITELVEGTYTFREKSAPAGYLKTDEVVTQYVNPNEMASGERVIPVELKNYAELKLKIIKFDQQSNKRLSGVTFEIYYNTELIGRKQTDDNGEINLTGLKPGTYLVKEVATDAEHVVDSTPQQIELKVGQTTVPELVFLNQMKPGMYLVKLDSESLKPMPNVKFLILQVGGTFSKEFVTDAKGEIDLSQLEPGAYQVKELLTIDGYLVDDAIRTIQLNPDETARFVFTNTKKPWLEILKYDPDNDVYIPGTTFKIAKIEDSSHYLDRVTDENGRILIENLEPGVYTVVEQAASAHYVKNTLEYHVELFPGKGSKLVVNNYRKPNLQIVKYDAITGKTLPNATFTLNKVDSSTLTTVTTGADGTVTISDLDPGVYQVTEKAVPDDYLVDPKPQLITLIPNETGVVRFYNYPKPSLTIQKVDSITGDPLKGAKFHISYASNHTVTGEINDIGDYFSDENGQIRLTKLRDGWYKITELEAPAGYAIKEPATQEIYVKAGENKVITAENTPLSAIVIKKVNADGGKPLAGAWFRVRYLGGTSGTGGTTIGEYMTSSNGTVVITGLKAGTYVIEEISAPEGFVINDAEQTVYLSGKDQDVVTVTFGNDKKGSLLIIKKDAVTGEPLSDVEFLLTNSDGGVIGNSNGKFVTDSAGTIRVDDLEPGMTVIAKETRTRSGYVLDDTPQTIKIKANETMSLEFRNKPKGSLIILKKDSQTGEPLKGVEFKVTTSSGELVPDNEGATSTNGIYKTDENGQIALTKLKPGTYVVTEVKTLDEYVLDASAQTVRVNENDAQTLTFLNTKKGSLVIKKIDSVTREPIADVQFSISGNGWDYPAVTKTTESRGQIRLDHLPNGSYTIVEMRTKDSYKLDTTVRTATVSAGKTTEITVENEPLGGLLIKKMNSVTKEPLSDVVFKITRVDGTVVGASGGEFRTDERGFIMITGLEPGGYVVQEVKAKPGFLLDDTPKHIELKDHKTYELEFFNQPKGGLLIVKKDSITGGPLKGVEFKVTTANGELVSDNEGQTSTNGIYVTDENGQIEISKLKPGTYTVTETKTLPDYVLDAAPQTVVVDANDTQTLTFTNTPKGCLVVKKIDSVTHEPISSVQFEVKGCNGCDYPAGTYTTDSNGMFRLGHIPSGCYSVVETKAKAGYRLDDTVHTVKVEAGACKEVTFENEPLGGLVIKKMAVGTKEPLSDVIFTVLTAEGTPVGTSNGQFRTNEDGYISIPDLAPGTYIIKEVQARPGYLLDDTPQTITVKDHQTYLLEVYNKPKGNLVIVKQDSQTGEPLQGVEFKITTANGELVPDNEGLTSSNGLYKTDKNGEIVLSKLKPGTYVVTEVKTLDDYVLDAPPQTVVIESNDTQTLTFTNTKKGCLVITKVDSVTHEPISGVKFEIKGCNGNTYPSDIYVTNSSGVIQLDHIPSGDYTIMETQAKDGYRLDDAAQVVNVEAGKTRKVTVENEPLGGLLIRKMDAATKEPISDVTFKITRTDGTVVGTSNGEFVTDAKGYISLPDLQPGSYIVTEIKAKAGYLLDNTPKTIEVKDHKLYTLDFYNQPMGGLIIHKLDSITKKPLQGVQFKITTADGTFVSDKGGKLSSNGLYFTDENGQIVLSDLAPNTYIVTEVQTIDGYTIDEATRSQTVVVNIDDTQTLYFYNTPISGLTLIKEDAETHKRISGVTLEVRKLNGEIIGTYTTGDNGVVVVPQLDNGWYQVVELKAAEGYKLDATPHQIEIKNGENAQLTITNRKAASILLHKVDSVTGKGIYGVKFLISDANRNPVTEVETDQDGYIYINKELDDGKYFIREIEAAEGYIRDEEVKTFYIEYGSTSEITWKNTAITGQIQIIKTSEDFNSVTNLPAGSPLPGAVFEIISPRTENVVETITTDVRGIAASSGLPIGWYKVREKTPPSYYYADTSKEYWVELKCAGDVAKLTLTNKSLIFGTSIKKTGNVSVIAGDAMRYDFSEIQNLSNVPLENFYWHEAVPYNYGRMITITTGTFNQRMWYSIEYKTNLTDYRTLATNLLTTNSYSFDVSATGLGLPTNEFVTDIRFNFGTVQPGFKETVKPTMTFRTFTNVANNTRIVNRTDVGGRCGNEWDTATAEWTTVVIGKNTATKLPKTGY